MITSCTDAKAALRRRFGLWPLMEARNRVLLGLPSLLRLVFEAREERRILRSWGGERPTALVASIIPTYRRPALLREAVDSALAQTITDQVVIVVDDGGGLIDLDLTDPRLHVVRLSRNTGVAGVVRNIGIRLTRSQYLAFLDDDNTWTSEHLQSALAAHSDDITLTVAAIERVHPDGSVVDVVGRPFDAIELRNEGTVVDSSAIVVRRGPDVHFSRIRRSRRIFPMEDWELVYRLIKTRTHAFIPRQTVRYLINPESIYTDWSKGAAPPTTHR